MKKIIIVNIIAIIFVFSIIEIISYANLYKKYKDAIINYNKIINRKTIFPLSYKKVVLPNKNNLLDNFRPIEKRDKEQKPIVLFGCSYTYGFGLEDNQTFSYKLANATNRTVINRGKSGTGLPFLYYQLNDKNIINELPKDTEYIIYTLIPDHFARLYRYRNFALTGDHTLRYKIKNDKLVIDKPFLNAIHSLFSVIILEEYLAEKNYQNDSKDFQLFNKLMDESKILINENFKDAKFVILYYKGPFDTDNTIDKIVEDYVNRNKDITLININEEFPYIQKDKDYWLLDNDHPSEKAWDLIVPRIIEKLNINTAHHWY